MKWKKQGLIYCPNSESSWAQHSALTPTPYLLNDEVIRIYSSFRDKQGIGRIGYVDVRADNPSQVLQISKEPVLDIGVEGAFDDNGVILGDILQVGQYLYLYYVGFQLVERVKFLAFTGLAISKDSGHSFVRYSRAPILDRSENGLYFRAVHSIFKEGHKFKAWIGVGSEWVNIKGKYFPKYNIRCIESEDGIHFSLESEPCLKFEGSEYRLGRPRVVRTDSRYQMFYTRGTLEQEYLPGYAESADGNHWIRKDEEIGINLSPTGWDSLHLSYLTPFSWRDKTYAFYNGNNMGLTGFGWAELDSKTVST